MNTNTCKHSGYTYCLECREQRVVKLPDIDYDNLKQEDIREALKTLYEFKKIVNDLKDAYDVSIHRIQNKCEHPESTYDYHGYDGYKTSRCDLCGERI